MTKKSAHSHNHKHHNTKNNKSESISALNNEDEIYNNASLLKKIMYSYNHFILFFIYAGLGVFDSIQQNIGTIPYFHIPFFFIPVYTSLALYIYTFFNAKLCATQSANFKKIAFSTIGYFLVVISNFFITQDKEKIQLLLYIIALLSALYVFLLKDIRLSDDFKDDQKVFGYERFLMNFFLIIIYVIQITIVLLYTDPKNQLYYNIFQSIAMGFGLATLGLTLCKTRLDNLKNFFIVIETITLLLSIVFFSFILWHYFNLGKDVATPITDKQIIDYAVIVIYICFCNLLYAFLHTYKSWSGAIFKLASTIGYMSLFYVATLIIYWY